jgi:two-component system, cell cycle sensor histidine kinase and response regulator CckA
MRPAENNRILIIDDNAAIHEDFRKILAPIGSRLTDLSAAETALFGQEETTAVRKHFEVESAYQGEEGLAKVRDAILRERPYAMAFVDVRMPPGWDGIETIAQLWQEAPDLQIVICTAYSDYSWQAIAAKLNASHNMVVLKKPFDNIEVLQLAHALCNKWLVTQEANAQLTELNRVVEERTRELDRINAELRTEIVEHRRTEEVLRESEERFRAFMDNSPIIAFIKDDAGRYVYLNKLFEERFKIRLSEWSGRTDVDAWGPKLAAAIEHNDAVVRESGLPQEFIENMQVPEGENSEWLVLKFILPDRTARKFIGGVGVDVTERNRLESQHRQAQKLEAVGQLAGGIAHDFNNILAVIMGYGETALARVESTGKAYQDLQAIMKAADRGAGLIHQLLSFSRKQVIWPRIIDVNSVLIETDKILHRLINEDIQMTLLLGSDIGCVKAEPGQVEQVVMNLVVNARDAMPQGGQLTIETTNARVDDSEAQRHHVAAGEYVVVQITDTGSGMSPETKARIFEPFFTTKATGRGTGLGLATCYGIAKQSGGFIRVESEIGHGSTFSVLFPRIDDVAQPSPARASPVELPRGTETVLVVEDDDALRHVTVQILGELGYEVIEAPDGKHAQEILSTDQGASVDLLLTDVGMPYMDGGALAKWAEQRYPDIKVLYVSGYVEDPRIDRENLGEKHAFLAKPVTRTQLALTVRWICDGGPR